MSPEPTSTATDSSSKRKKIDDGDVHTSMPSNKKQRTRIRQDSLRISSIQHLKASQFLMWRMSSSKTKGEINTEATFDQSHFDRQCDRQIPCSHVGICLTHLLAVFSSDTEQCISRKVPELCKAYTPGKADQDFNARISRLEGIIEMALPQFWHGSASGLGMDGTPPIELTANMGPLDEDSRSQAEEQDLNGGSFQSGKWYGNSASGSIVPGSLIEQVSTLRFFCIISF